mmetsp:Transcript_59773/g.195146  ORF Transcript_59773/g.195146 Transcript_59773/m.195146 type:complete len:283 (+) Transcript_59773:410-1258(+)
MVHAAQVRGSVGRRWCCSRGIRLIRLQMESCIQGFSTQTPQGSHAGEGEPPGGRSGRPRYIHLGLRVGDHLASGLLRLAGPEKELVLGLLQRHPDLGSPCFQHCGSGSLHLCGSLHVEPKPVQKHQGHDLGHAHHGGPVLLRNGSEVHGHADGADVQRPGVRHAGAHDKGHRRLSRPRRGQRLLFYARQRDLFLGNVVLGRGDDGGAAALCRPLAGRLGPSEHQQDRHRREQLAARGQGRDKRAQGAVHLLRALAPGRHLLLLADLRAALPGGHDGHRRVDP